MSEFCDSIGVEDQGRIFLLTDVLHKALSVMTEDFEEKRQVAAYLLKSYELTLERRKEGHR